ncbi:MAG: hypothetical protein ACR2ND_07645 [Solirubrobacteraceae bacterium]
MTLAGLAPHSQQVLSFSGPGCLAGATVTATVDPAGQIVERTRADNSLSITC